MAEDLSIARPFPTQDSTKEKMSDIFYIYAPNGIRTHDHSVRADQVHKHIKVRGHWCLLLNVLKINFNVINKSHFQILELGKGLVTVN
jgi:hypothetical protein